MREGNIARGKLIQHIKSEHPEFSDTNVAAHKRQEKS